MRRLRLVPIVEQASCLFHQIESHAARYRMRPQDASNTSTIGPRGAAMPRTRVEPRFSLEYLSILDAALGPRPPNDRLQRLRARRALGPGAGSRGPPAHERGPAAATMTKKKVLPGLGVDTPTRRAVIPGRACHAPLTPVAVTNARTTRTITSAIAGRSAGGTADGSRAPLRKNEDGTPSPKWTRTGDPRAIPPTVTVTPSVWPNAPHGWHGFLTDGALVPAWTS